MAKGLLIAVLLGCGVPAMALAASGQPSTLQQFLAKRFKPGRGVFGAIASAIPVKLDPDSIAGMEGRKPDGSYWTSAFFNRSNTVMFDDPRNALAKFCTASGGALKRLRGFDLSPKHDLTFFSVVLTDGVARAALELPKLRAFQSSVKVGDDTSCGLVLTINGPLVEVQVPDTVRLENGASRLFVKRTQLTAKRSPYTCYIHDPIARRSSLSASPEALMSQP